MQEAHDTGQGTEQLQEVHIYAEAGSRVMQEKERMAGYVMEVRFPSGKIVTKEDFYLMKGTYNEVIMDAFARALERMTKSCELHLHTQNSFVLGIISGPVLEEWESNGFMGSKGRPVKHSELWESISRGISRHQLYTETGQHSYYRWMMEEMQRRFPGKVNC